MSRQKINPEFSSLAYRKRIEMEFVVFLTNNYTAANGGEPARVLRCDELPVEEADIPQAAIFEYIGDMNQSIRAKEDEMALYNFRKKSNDEKQPATSSNPSPQGKAHAGKLRNHRQGRARKGATPAQ